MKCGVILVTFMMICLDLIIIKLQKALRTITVAHYLDHAEQIVNKLNVLIFKKKMVYVFVCFSLSLACVV